jgi:hypothetical protein
VKDEVPTAPEEKPQIAAAPARQSQLLQPGTVESSQAPNLAHGLFKKKAKEETRPPIDGLVVEDVLPVIRDVVTGSAALDREEAIHEIARRLGAERVGSRIRALIESALNTASRRSIVYSDQRGIRPLCRSIEEYKRDDLKNVLRAVIGRTWTDEADAIRAASRYLGFRRTGSQIERAFRSAISGGLRQSVLERDGRMLRAKTPSTSL